MKKFLSLALISAIAAFSFAQAPAVKKAAKQNVFARQLASSVAYQANDYKAQANFSLEAAKAAKAAMQSVDVAKAAPKAAMATANQIKKNTAKVALQNVKGTVAKEAKPAFVADAPRFAAQTVAASVELNVQTVQETWYGWPDYDWFIVMNCDGGYQFRFDIGDQSEDGLELDHEYTYADMIEDYTWGADPYGGYINYASATVVKSEGANGYDWQATVEDVDGNSYSLTYTTVAGPEITDYQTIEFSIDETDLVDVTADQGAFQFIGSNAEGVEAYVAFYANSVAGSYTTADLYAGATRIFLSADDYDGVAPFKVAAEVVAAGAGYTATVVYDGLNGVEYTLIFNYNNAVDERLVTVPETAVVEDWYMKGINVTSSGETGMKNLPVKVAFDGDDVYVGKLFSELPDAWVKGSLVSGVITFPNAQYLGSYAGQYEMFFIGIDADYNLIDFTTATYSEEDKTIAFDNDILANASLEEIYYLTWYSQAVLSAEPAPIVGAPVELPMSVAFGNAADYDKFGVIDANGDGSTWAYDASYNAAKYAYNSYNKADDYLVSPAVYMEAGKSYSVSVNAAAYSSYYAERIEVVMGTATTAAALSTVVIEPTDLGTDPVALTNGDVTVEESGYYHIAAHAVSDADMFYLLLYTMDVKENDPEAPKAVENLVAVPGEYAALVATVSFTAPTTTVAGDALAGMVKCIVSVDGAEAASALATPGQDVTVDCANIASSGLKTFSVVVKTMDGLHVSEVASTKAYVGYDAPVAPENFAIADCGDHLGFSWEKVGTVGAAGGYVDPTQVTYQIWDVVDLIPGWGLYVLNEMLAEVKDADHLDYEYDCNAGVQDQYIFAVMAVNDGGESSAPMVPAYLGAPDAIPAHEGFDGGSVHYNWFIEGGDAISAALVEEGSADAYAIELNSDDDNQVGGLISGKFVLTGADNATVSADLYSTAEGTTVTLYVEAAGELTKLDTYELTDEWAAYKWNVAAFNNEPAVRFHITANFTEGGSMLFDNFNVLDLYTDNLVVAVAAPAKVVAGKSVVVTATVKNEGENVAEDYSVNFYINGKPAAAPMFETVALNFFESTKVEFELETSVFDQAGDVTVKAEVVYAADLKPENNSDEVVITVVTPSAAPVETVAASNVDGGIKVEWTVGAASFTETTEDFESYDEFAYVQNGEQLGEWTGWDLDGGQMYGWNGGNWPHMEETGAFGIYNPTAIGFEPVDLPSGLQTALVMAAVPGTGVTDGNDDWMVSPELPGIAQTISFMVAELTDQYGDEHYQVLASSTGNTPECFEVVLDTYASVDWTEVLVDLPAGTKYFAIRCLSVDVFGLLVDDVNYTVGGGDATGYNVYIDQVLVATVEADKTSCTYTEEIVPGYHEISVTAVYGVNESAPVTIGFDTVTAIDSVAASQNASQIYNLQGIRVNAAQNGVYVVDGVKTIVK